MKKIFTLAFIPILIIIMLSGTLPAEEESKNAGTVTETTNIHFTGKYCSECHEKIPKRGKIAILSTDKAALHKRRAELFLKFNGNFSQLCRCHGYAPGTYIHPVDIVPSKEKLDRIPENMPVQDGKITCSTCHDIYAQCQYDVETKKFNRRFLRGAPFNHRTDICFSCHDESKYKMLDPHKQLDSKGQIVKEKCLYCHVEKPDENSATLKDIKVIGNFEVLCYRCHFKQSQLHPINANHLREPSEKTLSIMKETEKEYGIILPLSRKGTITCVTCHNPHERGVIPAYRAGAKGSSRKNRSRLPMNIKEICIACHKDKLLTE